jgi:hypothetical protein
MSVALTMLLTLALQAASPSADVEVRATLGPDSVAIGQPFTLTISVTGLDGAEVVFPELPDTGAVTALGPPQVPGGQLSDSLSARYELAAWRAGHLELPTGDLVVVRDGAELAIPLPGVVVQVTSILPERADPDTLGWEPPTDVVGANWSLREKLIGAGLAIAALLAIAIFVRRKIVSHPVPPPPAKTPAERALDAFRLLGDSGLVEAGELKGFYSALSYILRQFLSESDEAWGFDLTTGEIVDAVGSDGVTEEGVKDLQVLLVEADSVKFARWRPSKIRAARALEAAAGWVGHFERIEPEPEVEPEPALVPLAKVEAGLTTTKEAAVGPEIEEIESIFIDDDDDRDEDSREWAP